MKVKKNNYKFDQEIPNIIRLEFKDFEICTKCNEEHFVWVEMEGVCFWCYAAEIRRVSAKKS